MNNIDPQEELQRILSEEISKNIDKQIISNIIAFGKTLERQVNIEKILGNLEKINVSE